jgi:hypothetical protein
MHKNELGTDRELHFTAKTITFLKEDIEVNLHDTGLDKVS